jgi:DNA polymerase-3 subunit alpha (Gram-positive type)
VDAAQAVKLAAKWGHPAIAITDHGVVHSFPEVASVAKQAGIKVIYGVEGYLVDDGVPIVVGASDELIEDLEFVIFDIETTGFNPLKEDLLEIGAVKYQNGAKIEEFSSLVRPGKAISEEIQKLTGMDMNYIRVNLSRARKQVREEISKIHAYGTQRNKTAPGEVL